MPQGIEVGWPVAQSEQYGRTPTAWLPELVVAGCDAPVVEVRDASGALVWARRIDGARVRPGVFAAGAYTVRVGDPDQARWVTLPLTAGTEDQPAIGVTVPR